MTENNGSQANSKCLLKKIYIHKYRGKISVTGISLSFHIYVIIYDVLKSS